MNRLHIPLSRNRPGVIALLAVYLFLVGLEHTMTGIWMIITKRSLASFRPSRISPIDYLLRSIPSFPTQIILSCLIGILFVILAWELNTLKPWTYWTTFIVLIPSMMIYDLGKVLLILFHAFPPAMFETAGLFNNSELFILDLVFFLLLLRRKVRASF